MKLRFASLILSLILIFTLVGCNKTEDAYIYFELPAIPETLDPQIAKSDSELLIVRNIYEGLMRLDKNGEPTLGAAESYTQNGLTYTFKIRESAKWSNGDDLTAQDFIFGIQRALSPETEAPFASRLFSIKNARAVNAGELSAESLGIKEIDSKTLKITLSQKDSKFLENLASTVAMPCNKAFFYESAGKYGLFAENIISNSSYRLTKWNKEVFGIRIYRNEEYTGEFYAKNAAVFLTCNSDTPVTQKLLENDIDISFIDSAQSAEMQAAGLKTVDCQNICWFITFSDSLSRDMRTALLQLVGQEVYGESLEAGYNAATSIYPEVFNKKIDSSGLVTYNLSGGKELYSQAISQLEEGKFPANIKLYYYDNGYIKPVITDIVGHWQSKLSAFVNIEAVDSAQALQGQLKNQTLDIAVFPIIANSDNFGEYLANFGLTYEKGKLTQTQSEIVANKNISPLLFQSTTICHSSSIREIYTTSSNGYIDFSLIVKED